MTKIANPEADELPLIQDEMSSIVAHIKIRSSVTKVPIPEADEPSLIQDEMSLSIADVKLNHLGTWSASFRDVVIPVQINSIIGTGATQNFIRSQPVEADQIINTNASKILGAQNQITATSKDIARIPIQIDEQIQQIEVLLIHGLRDDIILELPKIAANSDWIWLEDVYTFDRHEKSSIFTRG